MKTKYKTKSFIVLFFCVVSVAAWGLDYTKLIPLNEKNIHWSIIQAEKERIITAEPNSPIGYKIINFGMMNTKDANSLFENWSFYGFDYVDYLKNPSDQNDYRAKSILPYQKMIQPLLCPFQVCHYIIPASN